MVEKFPAIVPDPETNSAPTIPSDAVEVLTDITVWIIGDFIQAYIDAGSEREVTDENEDLREAIRREFDDWSIDAYQRYLANGQSQLDHHKEGPSE